MSEIPASSAESTPIPTLTKVGTEPVPVQEHKYKRSKKEKKPANEISLLDQLSPFEQIAGVLMGIAIAYGAHQLVKFLIGGRLKGKLRKKRFFIQTGTVPVQSISKDIEFNRLHIFSKYGVFGFKLWVCFK